MQAPRPHIHGRCRSGAGALRSDMRTPVPSRVESLRDGPCPQAHFHTNISEIPEVQLRGYGDNGSGGAPP